MLCAIIVLTTSQHSETMLPPFGSMHHSDRTTWNKNHDG